MTQGHRQVQAHLSSGHNTADAAEPTPHTKWSEEWQPGENVRRANGEGPSAWKHLVSDITKSLSDTQSRWDTGRVTFLPRSGVSCRMAGGFWLWLENFLPLWLQRGNTSVTLYGPQQSCTRLLFFIIKNTYKSFKKR